MRAWSTSADSHRGTTGPGAGWIRLAAAAGGWGSPAIIVLAAISYINPDSGYTTFGSVGGIFVIGLGMLALGVPLMIACAVRYKAFFRGETLNADTPILVPDTGEPPRGGL